MAAACAGTPSSRHRCSIGSDGARGLRRLLGVAASPLLGPEACASSWDSRSSWGSSTSQAAPRARPRYEPAEASEPHERSEPTRAGGARLEQSAAGGIRGRLDIRRIARPPRRRPDAAAPGAAGPRDVPDLRRGVVYLETAPRGAFERTRTGPRRHGPAQRDVRAARAGRHRRAPPSTFPTATARITTSSRSRARSASTLAAMRRARSKSVRFDRPGIVRVFCDIHSHMNAFILVFNHPLLRRDRRGRPLRASPDVPPGTYTLVGWNEGVTSVTRPVVVPAGGWRRAGLLACRDAHPPLAQQPHLPRQHAAGRRCRSARRSTSSAPG